MRMRRCYHRASGSIREAWQSSADTRTLLAYDKSSSFDQRPSGFADDLVSTNLTEQGPGYLWARTLEIGSQDAYVGIGFRNARSACKASTSRAEKNKGRGQLPVWKRRKQGLPEDHHDYKVP